MKVDERTLKERLYKFLVEDWPAAVNVISSSQRILLSVSSRIDAPGKQRDALAEELARLVEEVGELKAMVAQLFARLEDLKEATGRKGGQNS